MEKRERGLGKMERSTSYGYRLNLRQRGKEAERNVKRRLSK